MPDNKTLRRLPLRQLLASSERTAREAHELVHTSLLPRISDFRDLSRPVRRKSHYPTMQALQNGLRRVIEANTVINCRCRSIPCTNEHLSAILDHAQREKLNRRV